MTIFPTKCCNKVRVVHTNQIRNWGIKLDGWQISGQKIGRDFDYEKFVSL